jgi:hypothetical protein
MDDGAIQRNAQYAERALRSGGSSTIPSAIENMKNAMNVSMSDLPSKAVDKPRNPIGGGE